MPRELRWKVVAIFFVLACALVAVYPTSDTLMWHGRVRDKVDNRGKVISRTVKTSQVDNHLAYYVDYLTCGIFHHKKDKYEDEKELYVKPDHKVVDRDVWVSSAGLTLGLDLAGGAELRYRVEEHAERGSGSAEKIIEILRKRIDAMGLKEPILVKEGTDRILVQLPGKDEEETRRMQRIIESSGHLEFRLVSSNEQLQKQAETSPVDGYHWYVPRSSPQSRLLIKDEAELTGDYITKTGIQVDQRTRELEVSLDFNAQGRHLFAKVTEENVGEQLAIILDDIRDAKGNIVKQGQLYSAPAIKSAIWGTAVISGGAGGFTQTEAEDLKTTLEAGGLPATLVPEGMNRVGPSLGRDSIDMGRRATLIGAGIVFLFMIFYYHKAGVVANIALLLNLLLVIGSMAVFQATLTLPGIAGLALTVGMAVDANVLIFERIREELDKKGLDHLPMAVKDGYDRARTTIIDSNLTTLGTALFLYMFGTGAVKGFAATLSLGLIFSMFTAIFVTRTVFEFLISRNWLHKLGMIRLLPKTAIDFTGKMRFCMLGSAILIVIGMAIFASKGSTNYDIDFKGGAMVHVATQPDVTVDQVRAAISSHYPDAGVQSVKLNPDEKGDYTKFEIKTALRGQAEIADAKPIPELATGDLEPFAGGYEFTVKTDRPTTVAEVQGALDKSEAGARVTGVGTEQEGAFSQFSILVKDTDRIKMTDTIRGTFADLSVRPDIARLLADKLVPDGFPSASIEDGKVTMEVNFRDPMTVARLTEHLTTWGYQDAKVAVKDKPDATDGTNLLITAKAKPDDPEALRTNLVDNFKISEPFPLVTVVGGYIVGLMKERALIALILSFIFIVGYLWFRFELKYGVAAVVALVHDVLITVGFLSLVGVPFNLTIVAALLTIIGYSVNDTVVIFDRVRENLNLLRRERFEPLVDMSINQTLSRTILTTISTMFVVLSFLIWGTGVIRDFALALTVGMISGTYSTVFIAAPVVVWWQKREEKKRHARTSEYVHASANKA